MSGDVLLGSVFSLLLGDIKARSVLNCRGRVEGIT